MTLPAPLAPPVPMHSVPPPRLPVIGTMPNPWFPPVAWVFLVVVPVLWLLSQSWFFPQRLAGVDRWPFTIAVAASWIASAQLVYVDAKKLNLHRLKLAKIKLTSSERSSPSDWGLWTLLFWMVGFPWYLAVRRKNWEWALWAEQVGEFANRKELRAALRAQRGIRHGQAIPW